MELIEKIWFHIKILITSQVMDQNGPQNVHYSIYGHAFFGNFLSNEADIFQHNTADYYLINNRLVSPPLIIVMATGIYIILSLDK